MFQPQSFTLDDIGQWQICFVAFGQLISSTLRVKVSTELHQFISHGSSHLIFIGCFHRGLSEQNEMRDKYFKET